MKNNQGRKMETAEIIDPGFSVADGEDVRISKVDQGLMLQPKNRCRNPWGFVRGDKNSGATCHFHQNPC
jgi:hypothetical protein